MFLTCSYFFNQFSLVVLTKFVFIKRSVLETANLQPKQSASKSPNYEFPKNKKREKLQTVLSIRGLRQK